MTDQMPSSGTVAADNLTARRIGAVGAVSVPWIFFVLQLVLVPGYLMPMFHHPIAGPVMIGVLLVGLAISAVTWFFLQRSQKPVVWILLILFIVGPQTLSSIAVSALGPAIVTIIQALGPVVGSENR